MKKSITISKEYNLPENFEQLSNILADLGCEGFSEINVDFSKDNLRSIVSFKSHWQFNLTPEQVKEVAKLPLNLKK